MVLPSSGSLSYNTIRAEFGSPSSNVYLSLYYRGGPYTYAIPANANITTSSTGTIAVNDFYGADNKGPYASFSGGTHNTGGKAPQLYYGAGGPSLPGMSDQSITVGGAGYNFNRFYSYGNTIFMTGSPGGSLTSAPTWSQRNFYGYNSSGGLAFTWRTGWACGRGQQPTPIPGQTASQPRTSGTVPPGSSWVYESNTGYPGGVFTFTGDSQLSTQAGQPGPSFTSGSGSALSQFIALKAN